MLGNLWRRLVKGRSAAAAARETEEQQMSPAERQVADESFEDRQADLSAEAHLGGSDPDRLLEDDDPSHR